jgi:Prion-inhibition and propagation
MAEIVSLALSAVVLIKPVLKTVHEICADAENFGRDAEKLLLRLSIQETRLQSMERILFELGKFPTLSGRLFDHLTSQLQNHVIRMLRQLYGLLFDFKSAKDKYTTTSGVNGNIELLRVPNTDIDSLAISLLAFGEANENAHKESTPWARKARWVMWDKRRTEKMIVEFEAWNQRFCLVLESAWWPLPFFNTTSHLSALEKDQDTDFAGLRPGITLRKLLLDPSISVENTEQMKLPIGKFQLLGTFRSLDVGLVQGQEVFVEYRPYELDPTGYTPQDVSNRIRQLAALLYQHKDPRFKVPRCVNYFDDHSRKRIGFSFEIPKGYNANPYSLSSLYTSKAMRPDLDLRFHLGHQIAESLMLLHSVGWVHKGLRSDNIVFFRRKDQETGSDTQASGQPVATILQPLIVGFEYSRHESDVSSLQVDREIARNIYRHPDRWGQPKEKFNMIHDIYGMVDISLSFSFLRPLLLTHCPQHLA